MLTEEQKRIKLAEFEGFKIPKIYKDGTCHSDYWEWKDFESKTIPDYFHDLNAVSKLEERLTNEQKDDYVEKLSPTGKSRCPWSTFTILHASATQRSEAIGITLGLWKEGE